ncbi:MAG: P27 family phage terminase small subunit [Bryobacteraceae bacterium]
MGVRGTLPTPTKIRILNGNPSRRPLPVNEPQFAPGIPDRPKGMSADARKRWDALVAEIANAGVLRRVDGGALGMLCEDLAMLDTLRQGLAAQAREITKKAKEKKQQISGNALTALSRTTEGRRTFSTIRELTGQIIIQRREFGLTPSSSTRVQASGPGAQFIDPLEQALCG